MKAFVHSRSARLHQTRFSSPGALNHALAYAISSHSAILKHCFWEKPWCASSAFWIGCACFRQDGWDIRTPENELRKLQGLTWSDSQLHSPCLHWGQRSYSSLHQLRIWIRSAFFCSQIITFGWDLTTGTQTAQVTKTLKQTSPVSWQRKYLCSAAFGVAHEHRWGTEARMSRQGE